VGFVCSADTVTLKNGQEIECQIVGYEKSKITATVQGEARVFKITTVESFRIAKPEPPVEANEEYITISRAEVGQHGFLKATLKVATSEDGRFIGTTPSGSVIIQGVDASGLVTGRWVKMQQRLKVVGTETVSDGQTLFVLEPFQPEQNSVLRAEDPALSQPANIPLRVRDIRN
jgi:hypothetical protein